MSSVEMSKLSPDISALQIKYDIHIGDNEAKKSTPDDIHLRRFRFLKFGDLLSASSSAQPSKTGFEMLQKNISGAGGVKLLNLDFRRELHFFVDGIPMSGPTKLHAENTAEEILEMERSLVSFLRNEGTVPSIHKKTNRSQEIQDEDRDVSIEESSFSFEEEYVKGLSEENVYRRLPVESGVVVIAEETIDQLIDIVIEAKNSEKPVHIHTHCSCGRKRSWQALAHIAFILCSKTMKSREIFEMLGEIGSISDIKEPRDAKKSRPRPSEEYWDDFHTYCVTQLDSKEPQNWSEWKKAKTQ